MRGKIGVFLLTLIFLIELCDVKNLYASQILTSSGMKVIKGATECSSCYIRELVPAENGSCPTCEQGCTGGVYTIPQYYRCAGAGTGEYGRTECNSNRTQIGTYYPCEEHFVWGVFWACVFKAYLCTIPCTPCLAAPSPATCAACIICVGFYFDDCKHCNLNVCEKGEGQDIYRSVFSSLSGETCEGE